MLFSLKYFFIALKKNNIDIKNFIILKNCDYNNILRFVYIIL